MYGMGESAWLASATNEAWQRAIEAFANHRRRRRRHREVAALEALLLRPAAQRPPAPAPRGDA